MAKDIVDGRLDESRLFPVEPAARALAAEL